MEDIHSNEYTRKQSGEIDSDDPIVCLLYLLMRDTVPPGVMDEVCSQIHGTHKHQFTNGWLAKYAISLAERIRN